MNLAATLGGANLHRADMMSGKDAMQVPRQRRSTLFSTDGKSPRSSDCPLQEVRDTKHV
jgi:hypothetical protein